MPGRPLSEIRRMNSEDVSNSDGTETGGELDCPNETDHMENPAATVCVDETINLI